MKFQRTCLLSTETHRMDGWMVRFLLDHSVGLEERYSAHDPSLGNAGDHGETRRTRELRESGRYTDFNAL